MNIEEKRLRKYQVAATKSEVELRVLRKYVSAEYAEIITKEINEELAGYDLRE